MLLNDGYYYILPRPMAGPRRTFLYYDTATGKAKVQNIVGVANVLKDTSSIVFCVEAVSDDAFVMYTKEERLALSLRGAAGTAISMAALDRGDNRQWWKLKSEGISAVVNDQRKGAETALNVASGKIVGASYKASGPGKSQQWRFHPVTVASEDQDNGTDDSGTETYSEVKENRSWLRDMLRYYSSRSPAAYSLLGNYPYERSHVTHPNVALRKGIRNTWAPNWPW